MDSSSCVPTVAKDYSHNVEYHKFLSKVLEFFRNKVDGLTQLPHEPYKYDIVFVQTKTKDIFNVIDFKYSTRSFILEANNYFSDNTRLLSQSGLSSMVGKYENKFQSLQGTKS